MRISGNFAFDPALLKDSSESKEVMFTSLYQQYPEACGFFG
jgi:hypothetical protein